MQKRGRNLEDFKEITGAIYCAMNYSKFFGMWRQLKETTLCRLEWNNPE